MKNAAAIKSAIGISALIDQNDIEKVAIDFDIDIEADYKKSDAEKINAAAGTLLAGLYQLASVSEGGFSISFNRELAEKRIVYLSSKSGGLFPVPEGLSSKRKVTAVDRW